jgi:hypothetical protein
MTARMVDVKGGAILSNSLRPHLSGACSLLRKLRRRFRPAEERDLDLHTPASFDLRDWFCEQRGEDPDDEPDPCEALIEQMLDKPRTIS